MESISRLLKNTHLLRCTHLSSLRRTTTYASFLLISRALHLNVFDQPVKNHFFNKRLNKDPHAPSPNARPFSPGSAAITS